MRTCSCLMFVATLLAAAAGAGAEKPAIQKIKDLYGRIESDIKAGRLVAKTFAKTVGDPTVDPSSYQGISGRYFTRRGGGAVDKIVITTAMTNVTLYDEYVYYEDGTLALYYTSTRLAGNGPATAEDRYYFSGGVCIRAIEDKMGDTAMDRQVYDPPLTEHRKQGVLILERAESYRAACMKGKSPLG